MTALPWILCAALYVIGLAPVSALTTTSLPEDRPSVFEIIVVILWPVAVPTVIVSGLVSEWREWRRER